MDRHGPGGDKTGGGSSEAMVEPACASTTVDALIPSSASTSASSRATMLNERQIFLSLTPNPAATISSLSSSLATAQASASALAQEVQRLQIASVSAVASAQSAASASAFSSVASVSSSAALALASASSLVANANAAAMEASRSADAAIANASSIQAQADLSQRLDTTRFTEAQIAIAIVVSIIGTLALSLIGFLLFLNYREKRDTKRKRQLKELILRPDTTNSSGSGDVVWGEAYTTRGARRPPRNTFRPPVVRTAPPREPPRVQVSQPPETTREEMEPKGRPMTSTSTSPGPVFSLFPRRVPGDLRESQYERGIASPRSPFRYADSRF